MKRLLALILFFASISVPLVACDPEPSKPIDVAMQAEKLGFNASFLNPFVPQKDAKADVVHPRGRKAPTAEQLNKRHVAAFLRHGKRVQSYPMASAAAFDCRTMGWVGPIRDQGNCGTCWDVAGCDFLTSCFIKAGVAKNDGSFNISPQYFLDQCGYKNDGCNGDDSINVIDWAKTNGVPREEDYGAYTAVQGRCKFTNQKLYQIDNWMYCTPSQQSGIASTQDIKNLMVQFGPISTAIAANSDWDNATPSGIIPYRKLTPGDVNHDVQIIGWDDTKQIQGAPTKGIWIGKNQWGDQWGDKGYFYMAYGSHQIGTEAAAATVAALPPPPTPVPPTPPTPVPPTPVPPTPPSPGGFNGTIAHVQTYVDGQPVGKPVVVVTPATTTGGIPAELTNGVSPAVIVDVLAILADLRTRPVDKAKLFADVLKFIADLGLGEAVPTPMPKDKNGRLFRREELTHELAT